MFVLFLNRKNNKRPLDYIAESFDSIEHLQAAPIRLPYITSDEDYLTLIEITTSSILLRGYAVPGYYLLPDPMWFWTFSPTFNHSTALKIQEELHLEATKPYEDLPIEESDLHKDFNELAPWNKNKETPSSVKDLMILELD